MQGHKKKKATEIANFIVNNITLAEVSTIVIERSMEVAEYIVDHNLDPSDMNSIVLRRKLYEKLKKENFKKARNPFLKTPEEEEGEEEYEDEERRWGLFSWIFGKKEKKEKKKDEHRTGFATKNK